MSAESEPKADETLQTRPASAFSRVWSRSFPVLLDDLPIILFDDCF